MVECFSVRFRLDMVSKLKFFIKTQMANVHYGNLFHRAVIKHCRRKQLFGTEKTINEL